MDKTAEIQNLKDIISNVMVGRPTSVYVSNGHSYNITYEEVEDSGVFVYRARETNHSFGTACANPAGLAFALVYRG